MKNMMSLLAAMLLVAAGEGSLVAGETTAPRAKYCLFVTVDALDRDYVARNAAPNISQWEKQGAVFPDALNVFPTLTTPNMTSLVTGAFPCTTTIGANKVYVREENRIVGGPRFNKAVTIAEAFKSRGLSTAAVQHFMLEKRGTDEYARTEKGGSAEITSLALAMLADGTTPTRLLAVLYQSVDTVGHKRGAESAEALAETRSVDAEIAKLVKRYEELGILGETIVVISSDHGMSHRNKQIDLANLTRKVTEGGWKHEIITSNNPPTTGTDFFIIQGGNLNCYFNRAFSAEERERLFAALRCVEGVGNVYHGEALRRLRTHPNAGDFIVEPAPGWWFGGEMGVHGRNTESDGYEMMFGPGIRKGASVQGAFTVDLVPTVLHLMDIPIPHTVDGKVLWQAVETP
ncbi:MAG: alkaline phosphatase family protein [bacterium]